jgi:hypothetical protein
LTDTRAGGGVVVSREVLRPRAVPVTRRYSTAVLGRSCRRVASAGRGRRGGGRGTSLAVDRLFVQGAGAARMPASGGRSGPTRDVGRRQGFSRSGCVRGVARAPQRAIGYRFGPTRDVGRRQGFSRSGCVSPQSSIERSSKVQNRRREGVCRRKRAAASQTAKPEAVGSRLTRSEGTSRGSIRPNRDDGEAAGSERFEGTVFVGRRHAGVGAQTEIGG